MIGVVLSRAGRHWIRQEGEDNRLRLSAAQWSVNLAKQQSEVAEATEDTTA